MKLAGAWPVLMTHQKRLILSYANDSSGEEGGQRLIRRAEILELVTYPLTEPLLAMETRPEARRLQQVDVPTRHYQILLDSDEQI